MSNDERSEFANLVAQRADRVPRLHDSDGTITDFRAEARRRQTHFRAQSGSPVGTYLQRLNGAVFSRDWVEKHPRANFLSDAILASVDARVSSKQPFQQLDERRLRQHLLSSMPLCFNLFGELPSDLGRLGRMGRELLGIEKEGREVQFEWSPGRRDPAFTDDQTAFDAALFFGPEQGGTVVGIETKFHEWAAPEEKPRPAALPRYREIAHTSGIFAPDWEERVLSSPLQQVWRDHLLLLSMLQRDPDRWARGVYVLVHPSRNPSFARAAAAYREILTDDSTFAVRTIEEVLDADVLTPETTARFRDRYLG